MNAGGVLQPRSSNADSLGHYLISERALFWLRVSEFRSLDRRSLIWPRFRSNGSLPSGAQLINLARFCQTMLTQHTLLLAEEHRGQQWTHSDCRRLSKTIKRPFDSSARCSRLRKTPILESTLKIESFHSKLWISFFDWKQLLLPSRIHWNSLSEILSD